MIPGLAYQSQIEHLLDMGEEEMNAEQLREAVRVAIVTLELDGDEHGVAADLRAALNASKPTESPDQREKFEKWFMSGAYGHRPYDRYDEAGLSEDEAFELFQSAAAPSPVAQPVQEPVGHVDMQSPGPGDRIRWTNGALPHGTPLFASSPVAQDEREAQIQAFNTAIKDFVAAYEVDTGEGIYQPNDNERFLLDMALRDALHDEEFAPAFAALVDTIARAATPAQDKQSKPTDISTELREYASNPGYSHNDYADTMRAAADEIERYYGGMLNWKANAQQKDRQLAEYRQKLAAFPAGSQDKQDAVDAARYRWLRQMIYDDRIIVRNDEMLSGKELDTQIDIILQERSKL